MSESIRCGICHGILLCRERNEVQRRVTAWAAWARLDNVMLSERSQPRGTTYCVIPERTSAYKQWAGGGVQAGDGVQVCGVNGESLLLVIWFP